MCLSPDHLHPGPRRPHRVVVLCSDGPMGRNTCSTLLRAGVHLVGIVCCVRRGIRARTRFALRWAARHGTARTLGQVLGRIYDRTVNGRRDRRVLAQLLDDDANREIIARAGVPIVWTDSYTSPDTIEALRRFDPQIFVVHTKYIVSQRVRELASVAVIGGHPGVTPFYRGAYSPFWALLRGQPDMVGYTVFLLDNGIDTGPVLFQERLEVLPGDDSHVTLAWRGMMRQAELQAQAVRRLDAGECVPLRPISSIPPDSYFGPPTLLDVLRYRRRQQSVR